ncbi:MAG: N-6 DNA methylase [Arcobacter sp.]
MNNQQIKDLEKQLWDSADNLRANSKLTAAEYKDPVLGLILLRFAQNRFEEAKVQIENNLPVNPRTGQKRDISKEDFIGAGAIYLQTESKYEYLANLPEGEDINDALNTAMRLIEEDYTDLAGILPKNYQELDSDLLRDLIRVFNSESVRTIKGDAFGRIYEYFLMKFSMSGAGAQEGGEFFTPPSLVELIVNFIEPDHGIIHDPACGSGGMFVQSGYFIKDHTKKAINEAIKVYGTELKTNNAKLAKMNLAIHGIEGKIIEDNSFYSNPHNLTGKCDFVMANPPFNVSKVDKKKEFVKSDARLPFGLPKNDNANYMWIQYFHSYLNENGRAGFVMASSATDAGQSEKDIRQKLIESGDVEAIVSISNNFFYTRSLPCHVWFFNKGKKAQNKDKILMIDARKTFRKVNQTINDFSQGQLRNLSTMIKSFRGEESSITEAKNLHLASLKESFELLDEKYRICYEELEKVNEHFELDILGINPRITHIDSCKEIIYFETLLEGYLEPFSVANLEISDLELKLQEVAVDLMDEKITKNDATKAKKEINEKLNMLSKPLKSYKESIEELTKEIKQTIKDWKDLERYFPDEKYIDVEGLCKIASLEEIAENDYSLTPGRYVGFSIDIDENFDYKGRMEEINKELIDLNNNAQKLFSSIIGVSHG